MHIWSISRYLATKIARNGMAVHSISSFCCVEELLSWRIQAAVAKAEAEISKSNAFDESSAVDKPSDDEGMGLNY